MFFDGLTPSKDKCCGCSACENICPKTAITIAHDDNGFLYPVVDPVKCIECGLCEKVCPFFHNEEAINPICNEAFAAVSENSDELSASSSGGVFSVLANFVLSKGGVIYGAAFNYDMQLSHVAISSRSELGALRGSKYLQSSNGAVFTEIKKLLIADKLVLYVGTGCQVAGLKLFLRKEYKNLITVDILCHGVPPQKVFDNVVSLLEQKHHGKVVKYLFRDKTIWGWSCSSSCEIKKENGTIKYIGNEKLLDAYFNAFIKGDNYRESCYSCPFATSKRSGDLTLGDFWGVENYISIRNIRAGVSAVLVNNEKGNKILSDISSGIKLYKSKLDDIKVINKTLEKPTPRPTARDTFFARFESNPRQLWASYANNNLKRSIVYHLKRNKITNKLIKIAKNILK